MAIKTTLPKFQLFLAKSSDDRRLTFDNSKNNLLSKTRGESWKIPKKSLTLEFLMSTKGLYILKKNMHLKPASLFKYVYPRRSEMEWAPIKSPFGNASNSVVKFIMVSITSNFPVRHTLLKYVELWQR